MESSSKTSESIQEALEGLRLFARGTSSLLRIKLKTVPAEYLLFGILVLIASAAVAPWWLTSCLALVALVAVLLRPEKKEDGTPDTTTGDADQLPDEPGAG